MTGPEHLSEAAEHKARSGERQRDYDPAAAQPLPARSPFSDKGASFDWYNPTADSLSASDRELRAANAHLEAARELSRFEDQACAGIPPAERGACPLLASWVSRVRHTERGVELELKPEVNARATFGLLNCHLAYDLARGFEKRSCPLFVKGLELEWDGARVVTFGAKSQELRDALHATSRRLFKLPTLEARAK